MYINPKINVATARGMRLLHTVRLIEKDCALMITTSTRNQGVGSIAESGKG